jgi:hypothetical protein
VAQPPLQQQQQFPPAPAPSAQQQFPPPPGMPAGGGRWDQQGGGAGACGARGGGAGSRAPPLSDDPPAVGSIHRGTVASIRPFGVFVALESFRRHMLVPHNQVRVRVPRACVCGGGGGSGVVRTPIVQQRPWRALHAPRTENRSGGVWLSHAQQHTTATNDSADATAKRRCRTRLC